MKPVHIVIDKENIAKTVLFPGDPLRAKYIAENFLTDAKLINTVRNMYGYTGTYNGKKVTVMAIIYFLWCWRNNKNWFSWSW